MSEFEKDRGTSGASAPVRIGAATHFITTSDEDYRLRVCDRAGTFELRL